MTSETSNNNKRIAKNTLFLYFRMLFLMCISLYTSRVILATLGVEDYGIYNVVGGVVMMFSFLNTAMAGATQRFLNYDMVKGDGHALNRTFCTSVIIHGIIAIIIVVLAESIGMWFLSHKMIVPASRMEAAFWVFQCSIFTMVITILSVPYNAAIIAHEKMSAFAYISILEVILKLLIVYSLLLIPFDKLKVYAVLMLSVSVIIRMVYSSYSHRHFSETKFSFIWDWHKVKEMGAYAGWNLIGNLALMGVTQGLNMLLNVFFGPVVNAARGVSVQIQAAINQIAQNFQIAINPQIVKSYAKGDLSYMHALICRSSKFSFLLLLIISLPVFIMSDQLLSIWLVEPPQYSSLFLRIILVVTLVDALSNPLSLSVSATGIIRNFQIVNGLIMLSCVPLSYFILKKFQTSPATVFAIQLSVTIVAHLIKLFISHVRTKLSIRYYIKKVYMRILLSIFIVSIPSYLIYIQECNHDIWYIFVKSILSVLMTLLVLYFIGLDGEERSVINNRVKLYTKRFYK